MVTLGAQQGLEAQLSEIRSRIEQIHEMLAGSRAGREWYKVEEIAAIEGKTPYTVREWCREGRINAVKRSERRGSAALWSISAAEVARIKDEGLLPPDRYRNTGR